MYATQDDIVTLYSEDALIVADRDNDGTPDAAAITRALDLAGAEINSHVAVRYDLPLAGEHDILKQYCVDIALYRLAGASSTMTEELRTRYDDAMAGLKRIAAGTARLIIPADPNADPDDPLTGAGPNPIVADGPERLFSREKTRGL